MPPPFPGNVQLGSSAPDEQRGFARLHRSRAGRASRTSWSPHSRRRRTTTRGLGHRGGVAYEAEVYRRLLQPLPDFRPKCLGAPADPNSGKTLLILQYVSNAVHVSDLYKRATRQQRAMAESARWIGKFHATHEAR